MTTIKPHKFCRSCGKKLKDDFVFSHYDQEDGTPLYSLYKSCPARHWYNRWHDRYLVTGGSFGTAPQYYTGPERDRRNAAAK